MKILNVVLVTLVSLFSINVSADVVCSDDLQSCSPANPIAHAKTGSTFELDETGSFKLVESTGSSQLGEVLTFMDLAFIPDNCVIPEGQVLYAADYPEFVAKATNDEFATQYQMPDLSGLFIRTVDRIGAVDPERSPLSVQQDAIRNITANINGITYPYFGTDGAFKTTEHNVNMGGNGGNLWGRNIINFDASRVVPTGHDNRPVNISMYRCVVVK